MQRHSTYLCRRSLSGNVIGCTITALFSCSLHCTGVVHERISTCACYASCVTSDRQFVCDNIMPAILLSLFQCVWFSKSILGNHCALHCGHVFLNSTDQEMAIYLYAHCVCRYMLCFCPHVISLLAPFLSWNRKLCLPRQGCPSTSHHILVTL